MMRITRITPLKNHLNTTEHLPGAPGINDFAACNFYLDAKMPFDSSDWINYNSLAHMVSFPS